MFSVKKFDFLIDGRAKTTIDKFIATDPKFEDICAELQTYNGYVEQTQEITSLEYFTVVRLVAYLGGFINPHPPYSPYSKIEFFLLVKHRS